MEKRNIVETARTPGYVEKQAEADPVADAVAEFKPVTEAADGERPERA